MGCGAREKLGKDPIKKVKYVDDHPQMEPGWAEQFARWVESELDRLRETHQGENVEPSVSNEESVESNQEKDDQ